MKIQVPDEASSVLAEDRRVASRNRVFPALGGAIAEGHAGLGVIDVRGDYCVERIAIHRLERRQAFGGGLQKLESASGALGLETEFLPGPNTGEVRAGLAEDQESVRADSDTALESQFLDQEFQGVDVEPGLGPSNREAVCVRVATAIGVCLDLTDDELWEVAIEATRDFVAALAS